MNDSAFYWLGIGTAFMVGQVETSDWWVTIFKEVGSLSIVAWVVWFSLRRIEGSIVELSKTTLKLHEELVEIRAEVNLLRKLDENNNSGGSKIWQ